MRIDDVYFKVKKCLVVALCWLSVSSVWAVELNVVTEYLSPFQIKQADGGLSGVSVDIVNALFSLTKDQAKTRVLPWARAYHVAIKDKNTLIYSMARTLEREDQFHWIGKIKSERFYFWGLKSQFSQSFTNIEQFKPYLIATSNQYNSAQFLQQYQFKRVYYVMLDIQAIGMLYKERVQLLLSSELVLQKSAEQQHLNFERLRKLFEVEPLNNDLYIAFSLDTDPNILQRFRDAYAQLVRTGDFEQIRKRWDLTDDY